MKAKDYAETVGKTQSPLERMMAEALLLTGIRMDQQYQPIAERKFRLDFADPFNKIAVECDGAVHRIKGRFLADIDRHNALTLAGWRWLRVGRKQIQSGQAIDQLKQLMGRL